MIENGVKPAGGACGESDSNRRSSKTKQNPKKSSPSLSEAEGDSSGVPPQCKTDVPESSNGSANGIIIDELLAYVRFYRDRCTTGYLHKLLVAFFLSDRNWRSKA